MSNRCPITKDIGSVTDFFSISYIVLHYLSTKCQTYAIKIIMFYSSHQALHYEQFLHIQVHGAACHASLFSYQMVLHFILSKLHLIWQHQVWNTDSVLTINYIWCLRHQVCNTDSVLTINYIWCLRPLGNSHQVFFW